jgi:hypothetical protein
MVVTLHRCAGVIYCQSNRDQCMSGKDVTTDVIDTGGQFFTRVNDIGCQFAVCVKTPAVHYGGHVSGFFYLRVIRNWP